MRVPSFELMAAGAALGGALGAGARAVLSSAVTGAAAAVP